MSFTIFKYGSAKRRFSQCQIENFSKPPFIFGNEEYTSEAAIGLLFGLSCALLIGLVTNTLRRIGKNVHFTINSLYYSIAGMIILGSTIMMTTGFSMPCQVSQGKPWILRRHHLPFRTIFGCYFTLDQMEYWLSAVWCSLVREKKLVESNWQEVLKLYSRI